MREYYDDIYSSNMLSNLFFNDYKPIPVKYEYVGDLDYITLHKKPEAVFQRLQEEFEDTKGLIRIRIS